MSKYTIGVDFGSLSGRAVLVDVSDGHEIASEQMNYPHAIMDRQLPDGTKLGPDWALQHPEDYLDVLDYTLPKLAAMVKAEDIVGIGIDCTCSTVLPVLEDGTPLCVLDEFRSNPHAYVKMWKHHGGQTQASRMTDLAVSRQEAWLDLYGGKVNAEWYFPKLLETLESAPEVYSAMAHYVEVADWLVWQLCGKLTRSASCLGYKTFYTGIFPDKRFFAELNPAFENVVEDKVSGPVVQLGQRAGGVTEAAARRWGLAPGTAVAAANIDAHVCVPAVGIDGPGKLLAIIGTSTCHIVMGEKTVPVPGMSGAVMGGVLPGYAGYEAGQSSVGDQFHWFEKNCVPSEVHSKAQKAGLAVQAYLTQLASKLIPGQNGLIALDWWNGNRSILADADLSGMIVGMTMQTTPEEIYRALIESTAYGARVILDNYRASGVPIEQFYASGGVAQKNELAMQIYADVLRMPVFVADAAQGPALGSAIFGAFAAGEYSSAAEAARAMGAATQKVYEPIAENAEVYEKLYQEYKILHDYFGTGENNVMKRLKAIRAGR
ncbi:MAG: ribulokinase [Clostridia bacterium]|nr:ribulokinase [Clostridia bacterium]